MTYENIKILCKQPALFINKVQAVLRVWALFRRLFIYYVYVVQIGGPSTDGVPQKAPKPQSKS